MPCKNVDDDNDDRRVASMYISMTWLLDSCIDIDPPMISLWSGDDESWLVLGDEESDVVDFFSLFFTVEFQKFLISLSVRPGSLVAICDHL